MQSFGEYAGNPLHWAGKWSRQDQRNPPPKFQSPSCQRRQATNVSACQSAPTRRHPGISANWRKPHAGRKLQATEAIPPDCRARRASARGQIHSQPQNRFDRGAQTLNTIRKIVCDIRHMNSCYDCDNPIPASPCDPMPGCEPAARSFRTSANDSISPRIQCQNCSADSHSLLSWHPPRRFRPSNPRSARLCSTRNLAPSPRGKRLIRRSFQELWWTHPAR